MNLFRTRRFLPLFITQFLGAFNDNLFKNALVILATYKIAVHDPAYAAQLVNLAFALFTLPSFLFSSLSGQVADKFDRGQVARLTKLAEVGLAMLGAAGLFFENLPILFVVLFGFGMHSAFFGTVKYAVLPQHLEDNELTTANAYVEAGTFLAILLGTITGGVVILVGHGAIWLGLIMLCVAVTGFISSRAIPVAPAPAPALKLSFNIFMETYRMVRQTQEHRDVFLCILGISWFWFVGATFLAQFSPLVKDVMHAHQNVVTLFLTVFSVGIVIGSLLCSRFMRGQIHAKLVPLGALGLSLFTLDFFFTLNHLAPLADGSLLSMEAFLRLPVGQHVLFDLLMISICGGFYIVPLYTLLQHRADKEHKARAIAANNLMNSVFMLVAALGAMALLKAGLSIPQIILGVGILNFLFALYICKLLPFSLIELLLKCAYRVEVRGMENYNAAGKRVLIVANHTSFLDAALLAAFLPDRITFAIHTFIARAWWIKPMLKLVDTFPIDPTNPLATKALIDTLKKDRRCMIFPEGRITVTGALMKIYEGPGMIADKSGAMVLPVRIDGAQYTAFSFLKGKVRLRLFPKITLTILPPRRFEMPEEIKGRRRREMAGAQLYDVMSEMMFETSPISSTLTHALLEAQHIHGRGHVVLEDQQRQPITYQTLITKSAVLAGALKRIVARGEKNIGLMMPNTVGAAVAFFAIQAMGCVTAMINFSGSTRQITGACRTGGLKTVLTSSSFIAMAKLEPVVEALQQAGVKVVYLEDLKKRIGVGGILAGLVVQHAPTLVLRRAMKVNPEDAAVMLFTSGSEGTPKAVLLSHRNLMANRFQLASRVDFGAQDIVFNCLPMFHAFGLLGGTLLPLLSGIRTFLYPSPLHYRIVPELVYDSNATILFGTDTFLAGYARFAHPYDFHSLRYVFAGAERLKDETRRVWTEKFGLRILEGYGATETAPVISVNTSMHYRSGTVGRMMPGMKMRLETVPGIENGKQLYVSGPNIMLGYMKDDKPEVLQPLKNEWYDTGDIVSVDAEGYITIRGRTKRFAKIAGEMVSLTAVENVITHVWPSAQHAIVSIPDARKGEAIYLITESKDADLAALPEAFRKQGLTELAIPRKMIRVEKLPLLGTGKTDYVKAREMALAQPLPAQKEEDADDVS